MNKQAVSLLSLFLLTSCDSGPSLAQACKEHPEICAEFQEDNYCKTERNRIIWANIDLKASRKDLDKYYLLKAYEGYEECMTLASQIQHIKLKEKNTVRVNNLLKTRAQIEKVSNETANSDVPQLMYFHWTRYMDEQALNRFLALEGSTALENPESQLHLGTYYAKVDQSKTLGLLFHALELYQSGERINIEIFETLSSIFADKKEYKQSYIWLKVLTLYAKTDNKVREQSLQNLQQLHGLDDKFLNKVAKSTLAKITAGEFEAPRF